MSWYRDLLLAALLVAVLVFYGWALYATGGSSIDIPPHVPASVLEGSQPTKELHNA